MDDERIEIVSLYYENGRGTRATAQIFNDNRIEKYLMQLIIKFMEPILLLTENICLLEQLIIKLLLLV